MVHLIMGHGLSWCFGTSLAPNWNRCWPAFWGESKCALVRLPHQCVITRREPTVPSPDPTVFSPVYLVCLVGRTSKSIVMPAPQSLAVGTAGGEEKTEDVATEKRGVVTCGAITACRTQLSTRLE